MTRLPRLLALCALSVLPACGASVDDPVLARFRGLEITQGAAEAHFAAQRDPSLTPRDLLKQVAFTETLAQAARAAGLDRQPTLALQLARLGDRPWVATLRARVTAAGEPSEGAIDEYLEENRAKLDKPRKVRLWNIFKRAPRAGSPAAREATRRAMEDIRRRLLAGDDFAAIAKAESEAVNRYRGGKMGAIPPGKLASKVEAIAFALAEGEISPVIAVDEGFVILRNAGFVEASTMSEQEARERIRTAMRRWNFESAWETLRQELFEGSGVEVFDQAIGSAEALTAIGVVDGERVTYAEIDALARSQGVGPQPQRLTDARIRATFLAQAFTRLAAERARTEGLTPAAEALARARAQQRLLLAAAELERRATEGGIEVSDDEARAFFSANASSFAVPEQALLSLIQLRLDDGGAETLRAQTLKARDVLERIRQGEISFAAAAREVSQHPSAAAGGDVGWKARRWAAGLGPNVATAFSALDVGEVSDVLRQDHLWILHLRETRPARALTFDESREEVQQRVYQRKLNQRRAALQAELLAEIEEGLKVIALPTMPSRPAGPRKRGEEKRP